MDLLARAKQLEAEGRSVLHLEVGEPDFPTPRPIIDAGIRALRELKTHYTPALGLPELRQLIAEFYRQRFDIKISARRIIVTPGASGALQLALSVLLDVGENVLLTDPGYPCNRNMIQLLGANSRMVPVGAGTQFQMCAGHIAEHWNENSVAAMIATPSNPTGTLIGQQELAELIAAVAGKGGRLIVDEIYQGLVYSNEDFTALKLSDDVFIINSFSKYFGMTGWRLGWMVVPDMYVDAIDRLAQNLFLAPSTVAQYAAIAAFDEKSKDVFERRVSKFKERRDFLLPVLRDLGFTIPVEPAGAFYIYADCSLITQDSHRWTRGLLENEAVAVTPGIDFGEHGASTHVRFAYTRPIDQLERACCRMARYIK
jgi:aspartate/methionine/tyrosine aminotransferase